QGRRYSWGYPAIPEQSEHDKVQQLLDMESIGITLSGGHALTPEQSTAAVIAHHPQAIYFGTRQGRIPEGDAPPDEVIALSDKGGALPDADPDDGGDSEGEGQDGEMAEVRAPSPDDARAAEPA